MLIDSWELLRRHFLNPQFRNRYKNIRTAREWYEQLSIRVSLWTWIHQVHDEQFGVDFALVDLLDTALFDITNGPIIDISKPPYDSVHFLDTDPGLIRNCDPSHNRGLRRATYLELYRAESMVPKVRSQASLSLFRAPFPLSVARQIPEGLSDSVPPLDEFRFLVTLDPTMPADVLTQQLETLLTTIRKDSIQAESISKFHRPELEKWTEMDLLPCIDLHLIAAALRLDVPKRGGFSGVLSRGTRGNSKIAQTVMPLAKDLLDQTPKGVALRRRLVSMALDEQHR